jgi:AhpD family alkylhydroperoxidase
MEMEDRIKALIAVGAAINGNCQPCLQSAAQMALESGANASEIAIAIEVGKKVRAGASTGMDQIILNLNNLVRISGTTGNSGCGCDSLDKLSEAGKNG